MKPKLPMIWDVITVIVGFVLQSVQMSVLMSRDSVFQAGTSESQVALLCRFVPIGLAFFVCLHIVCWQDDLYLVLAKKENRGWISPLLGMIIAFLAISCDRK